MGTPAGIMVTAPKVKRTFCAGKKCKTTPCTRLPSTRLARPPCTPRVSVVTIANSRVTEDRPSLCSTRRQRPPRRLCCVSSAQSASTSLTLLWLAQALRACRCRQWKAQEEELDIAQKRRYLALDVLGLLLSFIETEVPLVMSSFNLVQVA